MKKRKRPPFRSRLIGACCCLALAPLAALAQSYGGAAALVAVSGWILIDERPVRRSFQSASPHDLLGKLLLVGGASAFAVVFAYLSYLTWTE